MDNYFIKLTDNLNNSETIINKITTNDTYSSHYKSIFDSINNDLDLIFSISSNATATISQLKEVEHKGYIYNTKTNITKIIYELSLVKINNVLSNIFTLPTPTSIPIPTLPINAALVDKKYPAFYNNQEYPFYSAFYDDDFNYIQSFKNEPQHEKFTDIPIMNYDLINELKIKLSLPNSGLNSFNNELNI